MDVLNLTSNQKWRLAIITKKYPIVCSMNVLIIIVRIAAIRHRIEKRARWEKQLDIVYQAPRQEDS